RSMASLNCCPGSSVSFFQAEDGIRDDLVTGVQTCSLPILVAHVTAAPVASDLFSLASAAAVTCATMNPECSPASLLRNGGKREKIGRASCRERGERGGGGSSMRRKGIAVN